MKLSNSKIFRKRNVFFSTLMILFCANTFSQFCPPLGHSINFGGFDEQITVPNQSSLNFGVYSFSFESWVKTTAFGVQCAELYLDVCCLDKQG